MLFLPLTLVLFSLSSYVDAGRGHNGDTCVQAHNRLLVGNYQFFSECDSQTYCSDAGICQKRGCRKDIFPFGYSQDDPGIPPMCPKGQFCPDEMDQCQPLLPVGSACQLNRDDQCEAPPNFAELADQLNRGLNFNGSVCLNNVCMWANATVGQTCVVENTPYIAYGAYGDASKGEFLDIVSRGNCITGTYCDSQTLVCIQSKLANAACGADKECSSYNCLPSGVCGPSADIPNKFGTWVYAVVAIGIIGSMVGSLFGMFVLHRRQRDEDREKRVQYWREQNAFRQNIMQMRDTATSILTPSGGNSRRSTIYGREGLQSVDSSAPLTQNAAPKGSGLRYYTNEDEDNDSYMGGIERTPDGRF